MFVSGWTCSAGKCGEAVGIFNSNRNLSQIEFIGRWCCCRGFGFSFLLGTRSMRRELSHVRTAGKAQGRIKNAEFILFLECLVQRELELDTDAGITLRLISDWTFPI